MSYYKKTKLFAILCAALAVVAAALVLTVGLPAKAPFADSTTLTVKCVDVPLDFAKLDTELASATDLPYTVTRGKDITGAFEAANVTFDGTGFTAVNAQTLVSTLGASYSVLSLNTVTGKNASGLTMYMIFVGAATLLAAGIYLAIRYGYKTAVSSFVPAVAAAAGALITAALTGIGLSYPLSVAVIGSFALALFFAALAFGQARELHESKHVHGRDDVADRTGAALMPRNIGIAVVSVIVFGAVAAAGIWTGVTALTDTAIPLLTGTLIGLFGAQLCAVPLCMMWQNAEDKTAAKKAHGKKSAAKPSKITGKTSAKGTVKTPAKKTATKKNIKKLDPAKPDTSGKSGNSKFKNK